jgi:putative Mg2+ transporter-C (MgtC) family protein
MTPAFQLELFLHLVVAGALAGAVGYDREQRGKPAGMRTHILVGVGACLFTVLSLNGFPEGETARVAAAIVSGIGFLGAGVIFQDQERVHGLTTAASIWVTAAIGLAVGAGAWILGLLATISVWVVLYLIGLFERRHIEPENREADD